MFAVKCLCASGKLLNLSCEFQRNDPNINEANMMIGVSHVTRAGEGKDADRETQKCRDHVQGVGIERG
jgi:hypothetical protein